MDEEAEKRKARAARFGIPLVEPKTAAPTPKGKKGAANGKVVKAAVVEVRVCALRGRWSASAKTFLCVPGFRKGGCARGPVRCSSPV